jgi:hypothetical protein
LGKRSNRFGEAIESLSDGDASIYHRPSQTITDEEGSLSAEISTPRAEHTRTAPSVCDQAVETITAAIIAARCSTVACERAAGRLGGLTAGVRQHIVTPLAGDPRQITTGKVVHCIAYLRSKPHITPTMITPRTVADELGPWLAAGEPLRFEPPPREHALASGRMSTRHGADWGRSTTRASTLAAEAARRDRDFEECKAKHLARYGHLNGFE